MEWIFSIRTKLFALVFSAFFALIAGIYWQIGTKAAAVSEGVIETSLSHSRTILDTRITSRFTFIEEVANGIARDSRVLPLVYEQESLTLQDFSVEYEAVYDFDILFFLDSQGTILARSDRPEAIGVNLAGKSSLFDNALNGESSSGFIASQGKLMQTVVVPIIDNVARDLVRGAVILAYELSHDTAQEIVALTESEIGFFVFSRDDSGIINGVEKSYMTDSELAQKIGELFASDAHHWQDILDSTEDDFQKAIQIESGIYHSIFRRVESKDGNALGFVVAMRSATELKKPFKEIQQRLLLIGSICLVFASFFAVLMALGVSRPIIRLVDITKQIQGGYYPSDEEKTRSKDEIGMLQNALVRMGQSLREKAELEAYLAGLADEVDRDISIPIDSGDEFNDIVPADDVTQMLIESPEDNTVVAPSRRMLASGSDTLHIVDRRYQLLKRLGAGAIGVVYLASDLDLDEKIAVKVMQKKFLARVEGVSLKEEIRLARKITHRNIVRTFDFGAWGDVFYITMEYVKGYDLGRLIDKKGALDANIGLAISKQICSAMMAAHQVGIIHRDLKPSNMIINRQGILKIMDFGLAMQLQNTSLEYHAPAQGMGYEDKDKKLVMGTPRYMAPEQFSGSGDLDARTDIYAIGAIMFAIFNGGPPYSESDFGELAIKHVNEPIPEMHGRDSDLPSGLREIIRKALAKRPEDRYQTVREIMDHLNTIIC